MDGFFTALSQHAFLQTAIATALALDDTARKTLTQRAARHVTELYSLEAMCARTLAVYDRLLAEV